MGSEQVYHRTCPGCGAQLVPNVDGPWTPPWRCDECSQSFWVAELTKEARACFRREQHDFGWLGSPGNDAVRAGVRIEAEQAAVRGVSLRHEQLNLVPKSSVEALLKRGLVSEAFAVQMHKVVD